MSSHLPALAWLLIAVPLAGGGLLAAAGSRAGRLAPAAGIAVAAATLGLACAAAAARPAAAAPLVPGIAASVKVDGLSAVMVLTVTAVTLAVLVFSAGDIGPEENRARFFGLMLLFAGAMLVTVTAATLALLLMGWEVMGAASYALIGFWWREEDRVTAGNTAFLVTRAGDLGLYLAAGAGVAGGAGGLALAGLARTAQPWLAVVTAGIIAAALGKSAQLPFSFWLSRAMAGPSPVSALLHAATMVAAGAYLLLRLQPLLTASGWGAPAVAWAGAVTALALGLVAVAQADLKQLLAASTCAQIGFMVLAAGAGGVRAGVLQLVAHAAVKSLLFLAAGAWLAALGTKQLDSLRGAARRYPLVGVTFTIGAVVLAGLPPGSLWAAKDEVLAAALHRGAALYATGLAAAAVSAVYSVKAAWYVWRPVPADAETGYDSEQAGTRTVAGLMRPPLIALAAAAAGLGALALPPAAGALTGALHAAGEPSPRPWELGLSALVAVAGSAVAWQRGARQVPAPGLAGWLGLEAAARILVARPVLLLARGLAAFDDRVLDRAVGAAARGAVALARAAAAADDLGVDRLVAAIAAGARWLGRAARKPQTGQLHTYYAQATAVLAVLALVFALAVIL